MHNSVAERHDRVRRIAQRIYAARAAVNPKLFPFFHRLSSAMTFTCIQSDAAAEMQDWQHNSIFKPISQITPTTSSRRSGAEQLSGYLTSHFNWCIRQPIYFPMPTPLLHTCSHRAATPSLATGASNSQTPHRCRPSQHDAQRQRPIIRN